MPAMSHDPIDPVAPARYAVIDCEDAPKWDGHPSYWLDRLRRPGEEWDVLRAWAGELPASPEAYRGLVLTGSRYSVHDDLAWLPPLFEHLRACQASPRGSRIVGACFGLQVVTHALGGRVGPNPSGRFVFGTERVSLEPAFRDQWFFASDLPETLTLLVSHGEQALDLPPGALRLARSATADNEVFVVGSRVFALQSHAELTREALVTIILPTLREKGRLSPEEDAAALASLERPADSDLMIGVIRRFLDGPPAPRAA